MTEVLECDDLLFSILTLLPHSLMPLLQRVNKCFQHTIHSHFRATSTSTCTSTYTSTYNFLHVYPLRPHCATRSLLQWAADPQEGGCPEDLIRAKGMQFGAYHGAIDVLEWMKHRYPETLMAWDAITCDAAARGGHVVALQWLRAQHPCCPWYTRTCVAAAAGGHLDTLKWLRAQDPPCEWSDNVCTAAAEGNHVEILRWLRSQDPPCPIDYWAYEVAALCGHLDVLKWWEEQESTFTVEEINELMLIAVSKGHVFVLNWLVSDPHPQLDLLNTCTIRKCAEENGQLVVLEWLQGMAGLKQQRLST